MDLEIKWRQDFELLECAEEQSKRKRLEKPIWHTFDLEDIYWHSRDYATALFSNGTPVVIREGQNYVVNNPDLFGQYMAAGKVVKLLRDCQPSTKSVIDVGFWG